MFTILKVQVPGERKVDSDTVMSTHLHMLAIVGSFSFLKASSNFFFLKNMLINSR